MASIIDFVRESVDEMRHKVTWPKLSDLQSSSVLVLVGALIFALIIGSMDFVFKNMMDMFYQSIGN